MKPYFQQAERIVDIEYDDNGVFVRCECGRRLWEGKPWHFLEACKCGRVWRAEVITRSHADAIARKQAKRK